MIVPNNMNPRDIQKSIDNNSQVKRGFNQTPASIKDNIQISELSTKEARENNLSAGKELYNKITAMKHKFNANNKK